MIINDLDGYYIVFDTKNWNTELDTLINNSNMKYKFTVVIESYDDSEDRETVKDCLEEWLEMNCGEEKDLGGYPDWKTVEVE